MTSEPNTAIGMISPRGKQMELKPAGETPEALFSANLLSYEGVPQLLTRSYVTFMLH